MANKKDKEKIDSESLVLKPESTPSPPMISNLPIYKPLVLKPESTPSPPVISNPPIYVSLPFFQHLFSIEKNHYHIQFLGQLAFSYFPRDFHWIPKHPQKNLAYYTNILIQTKSIHFRPIMGKNSNYLKILGNIAYFANFISEKDWGTHSQGGGGSAVYSMKIMH